MDGMTWKRWCVTACIAFVCITNDATTEALRCYSCWWSSDKEVCKTPDIKETKNDPDTLLCMTGKSIPRKFQLEKYCAKEECQSPKPVCGKVINKWDERPLHLQYACMVDKGKTFLNDTEDDGSVSEGHFCKEDLCNGGMHSSTTSILLLTLLTVLALLHHTYAFM